jgi:hypothetical protein
MFVLILRDCFFYNTFLPNTEKEKIHNKKVQNKTPDENKTHRQRSFITYYIEFE